MSNPKRRPESGIETSIIDLLGRTEESFWGSLVSVIAEKLYREEIHAGAWVVDLGLLGRGWFVTEARRVLESGDGELWEVG